MALKSTIFKATLQIADIDRGYYAPIPRVDLERYASQLPAGFPCCAKAPEFVTAAALGSRAGAESGRRNPDFLNPRRFEEEEGRRLAPMASRMSREAARDTLRALVRDRLLAHYGIPNLRLADLLPPHS